jgi:hypothetical protein
MLDGRTVRLGFTYPWVVQEDAKSKAPDPEVVAALRAKQAAGVKLSAKEKNILKKAPLEWESDAADVPEVAIAEPSLNERHASPCATALPQSV